MRAFLRLRFFIIVQAHAEFLSDIPTAALSFFPRGLLLSLDFQREAGVPPLMQGLPTAPHGHPAPPEEHGPRGGLAL